MATHSSTLEWRIPWTEEPSSLESMGSQSRTQLKWLHTHTAHHWVPITCLVNTNHFWLGQTMNISSTEWAEQLLHQGMIPFKVCPSLGTLPQYYTVQYGVSSYLSLTGLSQLIIHYIKLHLFNLLCDYIHPDWTQTIIPYITILFNKGKIKLNKENFETSKTTMNKKKITKS